MNKFSWVKGIPTKGGVYLVHTGQGNPFVANFSFKDRSYYFNGLKVANNPKDMWYVSLNEISIPE
jgi:hypothetical protein